MTDAVTERTTDPGTAGGMIGLILQFLRPAGIGVLSFAYDKTALWGAQLRITVDGDEATLDQIAPIFQLRADVGAGQQTIRLGEVGAPDGTRVPVVLLARRSRATCACGRACDHDAVTL